jgi:hypothetical protein
MDIDAWLKAAVADARRRGLPELEPFLEALAKATETLRATDFDSLPDELASDGRPPEPGLD